MGDFRAFFEVTEPVVRRALVAAYGAAGRDAAADALAYAWEHWDRVDGMENAPGYLFRVGQSRMRWYRRRAPVVVATARVEADPWFEPALAGALGELTRQQRVAVVLCHGYAMTHREVADLIGVSASTVQNHVERGLAKLRARLEVSADA